MRNNDRRRKPEKIPLPLPSQPHDLIPKICIMNLPLDIKRPQLMDLFKPYGTIVDIFIKQQHTISNNTFGFVEFKTVQQAASAILGCDNQISFGRRINVKFAKSKKTHNDSLDVSTIANSCCCSCHSQTKRNRPDSSWIQSNQGKKSGVINKGKRNEEIENINLNDNSRFLSQDEKPNGKGTKNDEGKDKMKITQVKKTQIKLTPTPEKKVGRPIDNKSEKKVEKNATEKEDNRPKPKNTEKSTEKPKEKEMEKEKKGDSLLALSTEISKSDASEDYYSYEPKPFVDFHLKRQH